MKAHKLSAFFVIAVLIVSVLYPLNVIASPHEGHVDGSAVSETQDNKNQPQDHTENNSDKNDQKPEENHSGSTTASEHSPNQNNSNTNVVTTQIPQTGPDEGDNNHPSGKDRSVEHGNSQTQGKSQSDPDGVSNSNGGSSGKDKIGFDGGLDKGDQDNNNGCGNDDDFEDDNNGNCGGQNKSNHQKPPKNEGGCDVNGSTGDKNGRPCNPGQNNASPTGCQHGEPDCDKRNDNGGNDDSHKDNHEKQDEKKEKNENSSNGNSTKISNTISNTVNINNQISINNQQTAQQTTPQVLGASVLAATGDYLFRLGLMLIVMGAGSFTFGLFFLFRKVFNKIFSRGYQSYLYLYEA